MQLDQSSLNELAIADLREIASQNEISTSGNKQQIIKRLLAAVDEIKNKLPRKFKATPKNGVAVILHTYSVPACGVIIDEDSPLMRFDYYLKYEEIK
jgi:SAP domain